MFKDQDIESRETDLYTQQFIGTVEDPNDPRKEGRAKIRVVGIHDDISTEDLPWAYPSQKSVFFGQDGKAGSLSVPKRGAIVAVKFNNGNHYSPEYYGIHEIGEDIRTELGKEPDDYLGSHVFLVDGDEDLKIFYTLKKGLIIKLRNSSIEIDADQRITLFHGDGNSSIEIDGATITVAGNSSIDLTSSSRIGIASNLVNVSGNLVNIGSNPNRGPAVKGDALMLLLTSMAALIDGKFPPSPGTASALVKTFEAAGLSKSVNISL
jgi:hypothetical protein